jgi:hypoxanthine phosphoribosyltransferase
MTRTADELDAAPAAALPDGRPAFAHPAEAEFAKVLDFYQIRWEYEPHTFPLRWAADGRPIESFTPDFYLPELDLYIELTTLKQSLVTKKNRKLRRIRELYPHVQVKLLYRRDIASLAMKYRLPASAVRPDAPSGE